ncbi:MAG: type II secretion system protein [Desulfurivibrionaceae bacterium]|jgi:prepilin-type N-terminal cleavage/methylation domain-containing protein
MNPSPYKTKQQRGFTLIELIMIIVILGILSVTAYVKWPVGMEEEAAVKEFRRAVRYAQHKAMTRQYDESTPGTAWGIVANANRYTIQRQNADCLPPTATEAAAPDRCAEEEYRGRALNNDNTITLSNNAVYFNALGEPINTGTGIPLAAATIFTINGTRTVTIAQQTGYVNSP